MLINIFFVYYPNWATGRPKLAVGPPNRLLLCCREKKEERKHFGRVRPVRANPFPTRKEKKNMRKRNIRAWWFLDVAIKLIGRLVISRLAITRDAGETARNLISLRALVRVDSTRLVEHSSCYFFFSIFFSFLLSRLIRKRCKPPIRR